MDFLVCVDIYDQTIGIGTKEEIHREGTLHRAFSVFIYHEQKLLIQKRALDKYHSGGLWANTCCSHPRVGEGLEVAVQRRMQEETGIDCPVAEIFSFVYRHQFAENLYEYEFDHVFIGDYDGEFTANPEEIEEMRWIDFTELETLLVEKPQLFSVWFLSAAPKVLYFLKSYQPLA